MSSFHMQKHGRCKAKGRPAGNNELFRKVNVIVFCKWVPPLGEDWLLNNYFLYKMNAINSESKALLLH